MTEEMDSSLQDSLFPDIADHSYDHKKLVRYVLGMHGLVKLLHSTSMRRIEAEIDAFGAKPSTEALINELNLWDALVSLTEAATEQL